MVSIRVTSNVFRQGMYAQLFYRQTELTMWVLLIAECGHTA